MNGFKEKIVREIIRLGKRNHNLRMPALALAALFLVAYHSVRNFFLEFRYHPVRQRILVGVLVLSLLAGQIGIVNVSAESEDGTTIVSDFVELPGDVTEEVTPDEETDTATEETSEEEESGQEETDTATEETSEEEDNGQEETDTASEETSEEEESGQEETDTATEETSEEEESGQEETDTATEETSEEEESGQEETDTATEETSEEEESGQEVAEGGEIELLMRPYDEETSSDMVYYLADSYESYSWEIWTGEEWEEIGEQEPEFVVGKEEWYTYRFRCIVTKDGVRYTAQAQDDWQIDNFGIMTMAANSAASGQSSYMYYDNSSQRFNVKGIDNNTMIQTTFMDAGYRTASVAGGGGKVDWNGAGEVAMGNSLYGSRDISLVYNGRYAKITYTVVNRGSASQSFQVGSSADVMIGNNDCAPVVGSANGLVMSGSPKNNYTFNLVTPKVSTLWYGYWTKAYDNMFTNLADRSTPYDKDSGMAWSWSDTVAPGQTWSRYVLVGVGDLPEPPRIPTLTNRDPQLQAGTPTVFTGTAEPGNTVCIEVGGEEFSGKADSSGNFSVSVTPPQDMPEGETEINYYSVSEAGGISDVGTVMATVVTSPSIVLTDTAVSVLEDSVLSDTWYRSFISSSSGTVSYNASAVRTGTPGTYTVTYTAKKTGYADATAKLTVTVLPLPLELSGVTATRVSGKDSFTLEASLLHTGGGTISETGFVWGIMQNPTVSLNNGSKKTSSVIKTKGAKLTVTAEQIVDGVTYYARAYVKTSDGNVYYSPQKSFSINGKSYGTFTITYNGGDTKTFTVTRTGGTDGAQTVYFRTVNGSAIGGTHFTHQADALTFAEGESSKQITIAEKSVTAVYNSKAATAYSNANRTYQVEIYRVDGGGALGNTTSATRTMAKDGSYVVNRNVYTTEKERSVPTNNDNNYVVDRSGGDDHQTYFRNNRGYNQSHNQDNFNVQRTVDVGNEKENTYLKNTAEGYYYRLRFTAKEAVDGWEHIWIADHKPNNFDSANKHNGPINIDDNLFGPAKYTARFEIKDGKTADVALTGTRSYVPSFSPSIRSGAMEGDYLLFGINDEVNVWFSAAGKDADKWQVLTYTDWLKVKDEKEPQLLGVAPMAGGTYKAGDKVTVSLVFDEIVDSTNSTLSKVSLNTTWGTFAYAGGADTNVLYFTGTVPSDAAGTLKVNSITGASYIKDMCNTTGTAASGSGSVTVSVDSKTPAVSITNSSIANQTAKATITATNADTLQYTWSQSSAMPVTGWLTGTSGQTVSTKQTSGKWYLHVLGTYNATGAAAHTYASFDFSGTSGAMPELTLSADNSTWAKSRTITLTKTPSTATVKVKTPSGTTSTVTGTSYTATANGSYTFTLTSGEETVVKSITVSKIDRTVPTAAITGPASLTQNENVILTITPADEGGAGVKTVTGTWTMTTNGGTAQTVTATLTKNSDGTYSATTPGSTGNNYTYKLAVTVTDNAGNTGSAVSDTYTVNLKAPTVTVSRKSSSNKGHAYSYTVNANGNTITAVQLPDGTITTALSGTFTLTSPGTYYVNVSDAVGHVVRSSAMTVAAGVDGDAPQVRLYQQNTGWADQARLDVSIYEEGSIASAVWKKEGASSNTAVTYFKDETSVYSGTFSVTRNGTYTVTVTDANGNVGTDSITVSNIDATAPKVTCTAKAAPNANSGWYTVSSLPVEIAFADEAGQEGGTPSGIQSVQCKLVTDNKVKPTSDFTTPNASAISSGTYTYNISSSYNGKYYLYYKVTDKKGNVTEGFSDLIQKDSNIGSLSTSRPDVGQPISQGLTTTMTLTYGPSGGYLTGGTTEASAERIATMEQHATGTKTVNAAYTAKDSGTYYIWLYPGARGGIAFQKGWFYVYKITFNSQGGSTVESQLIWTTQASSSTSTTVQCRVAEPADPTCTGYTFGGWYTDAACTAGNEFDFTKQVRENTILYAKWTANTYNVTYHLANPDGSAYAPAGTAAKYTYGQGLTLPGPTQTGFTFCGWYDNASYTGKAYTSIAKTATGDKEYYAYFKDTQAPVIAFGSYEGVASSGAEDDWQRTQDANIPRIRVSCTDNVSVKEVSVKVDNGSFSGAGVSSRITDYYDYDLLEGEHTYTFKAVDAAGNETVSDTWTVKLDGTKPEIGEITCEKKVTGFLNWIIGRESLIVHIPVTDSLSGVASLTYTETTITAAGETTQTKTVSLSGKPGQQTADLKLDADWKGRISNITCTDRAGNVSDSKTVGGTDGGVIVEDNPPVITITEADMSDAANPKPGNAVSADYYEESAAPTLYVSVQDDSAGVSAGIRSITYSVDGGAEQTVSEDFAAQLSDNYVFTIPLTGCAGVVNVTVRAADYAGNTAQGSVNVKIKGKEAVPNAKPAYLKDALANLTPGAAYEITVPAGDGGTIYTCTADGQGEIPLILPITGGSTIDLCGRTIGIVKKGEGNHTTDSDTQTLAIVARPPAPTGTVTPELAEGMDDAVVNIIVDEQYRGKKEYSTDGGVTWTDVPDDDVIKDLAPGNVLIRKKATEEAPCGLSGTVTVTPSSTKIKVEFALNYAGSEASSAPSAQSGLTCKAALNKPNNPVRDGFDFTGWYKSAACEENERWRFEATEDGETNVVGDIIDKTQDNYKDQYTVDSGVITVTLYAGWRENVKPNLNAVLMDGSGQKDEKNWYPALFIDVIYSDNVGVTKLYAKMDDGAYTELETGNSTGENDADGYAQYHFTYNDLQEGEHTYTFKAVDAVGNETETILTAKRDSMQPVFGEAAFNEGYKNLWDWIIRKDSLIITLPVTEAGSGLDNNAVEYILTPAGELGGSRDITTGNATVKKASDGSYTATITIAPDFKGTVTITAKDKAGNVSDTKTIGADGSGIAGIIVEDNAPVITIMADRSTADDASTQSGGTALSEDYYNSAPKLFVKVEDDAADGSGITSGLAAVSWKIGDSAEHTEGADFESDVKTSHSFTINALEGKTGILQVTVKAVDQVGNTAQKTVTVSIKARAEKPTPDIDYFNEKLTGLEPGGKYGIGEETIIADAQGCIAIREEWFGGEHQIHRKGEGNTLDSENADLSIAVRPDAPDVSVSKDETIKGKNDAVLTGVDTTMEYSADGGVTWTALKAGDITDECMKDCPSGRILIRVKAADSAPHGESAEVTALAGRPLTVTFEENGGSSVSDLTGKRWHDTVTEPETPVRAGYALEGWYQDDAYTNIWHFASAGAEADLLTDDLTLYAKWRDSAGPAINAVLKDGNGEKDEENWYQNLFVTLICSDNVGVTKLYVRMDGGAYAELAAEGADGGKDADGNAQYRYIYNGLEEGEHSYTFKAVDEAGNETETELTAKLDSTKPVLGEAVFNEGYKNLWDWIIRKDSLIITLPVTEAGSGIGAVEYTLTPADGQSAGSATGTATVKKTSGSSADYTATISIAADFKGTIAIVCTDKAGNTSAGVTVGTGLNATGIIIEDHAPVVTITLPHTPTPNANGWYSTSPEITVSVTDGINEGGADILSGGIAGITWKDGEKGAEQTVSELPGDAPVYEKEFAIQVTTDGIHTYYINAVDNAGNESGWKTVTVSLDTGSPVFSGDTGTTNRTQEGADITFTPSEGGKVYWIVDAGTKPGAQEVADEGAQNNAVKDITGGSSDTFTITGLTSGEIHTVYVVLEDAAGNLSEVKEFSFVTLQAVPEIALENLDIDHEKETVKLPEGFGEVEVYTNPSDPQGSRITPDQDGSLPIAPGTSIYIRYPEKTEGGMTTPASDSARIDIPDRPAPPAAKQVTVTDTTVTVTNPGIGEEYVLVEKGQTPDWSNPSTTGQFTGLDPNAEYDTYVRKKATGDSFASEPVKTEVRTSVTIKEPVINGGSDNNGGSTSEDNSDPGRPVVTPPPVAPPADTPQPAPGTEGSPGIITETQPTQQPEGSPEQGAEPENADTDTPGQDNSDPAQTDNTPQPESETTAQNVPAKVADGRIVISGEAVETGNITETSETTTLLKVGNGAVVVTVVCEDEGYAAGVKDTAAVANAVLTPEQIQLVNDGETIEVRIDVKDISETVTGQDKEVIESGLTEYQKEIPELTLGMYVDISMFIRIGEGDWDAVTATKEPIEVIIGIPEELQKDGREFYIIRSHEGEYTLLNDMDNDPDTITISTDMFSAYAIAYRQADEAGGNHKCGLCHICPTFLSVCYFIWLAIIIAAILMIVLIVWHRKKDEEKKQAAEK